MAINTNYSSPTISYLNDPRYTQPAPGADDKMLKYADGLTKDKDHGGFHADYGNWFIGENSYDANNHGDANTRTQISNWADVLRSPTSSPEDKATARRELSALIPKQLASLKSDTSGINGFSEQNGYDLLVNNGKIKGGNDYFQPGFDTKDLGTLNGDRLPDGLDQAKAAAQLTGDYDPKNLSTIATQLQASGDPDLQGLGTKLAGLVKNVQDRQAAGAKGNDVLLNVSANAITDLMDNQIKPFQAAIQAHIAFSQASTVPGDAGTQAAAEAISQLDLSKLPNGIQSELQGDLDLYNRRNPNATQLSLKIPGATSDGSTAPATDGTTPATDMSTAAPGTAPASDGSIPASDGTINADGTTAAQSSDPATYQGSTVGNQTYTVTDPKSENLKSIAELAMYSAYAAAGRGIPQSEEVQKYFQALISANFNARSQPNDPNSEVMSDLYQLKAGWTLTMPTINLPGATSNVSLPANARYNASSYN